MRRERFIMCVVLGGLMLGCPPRQQPAALPGACENDPGCAARQRVFDCSKQCVDDPACVDRCREMNVSGGQTGR
jgi:hypothetical protein